MVSWVVYICVYVCLYVRIIYTRILYSYVWFLFRVCICESDGFVFSGRSESLFVRFIEVVCLVFWLVGRVGI